LLPSKRSKGFLPLQHALVYSKGAEKIGTEKQARRGGGKKSAVRVGPRGNSGEF